VFRTVNDQPSLWESILPEEVRRLPDELARVDALLDDPVFFAPFVPFFDPRIGRPSTPMETYLRLMFSKFRYRLGYETLCREVSDSCQERPGPNCRCRVLRTSLGRAGGVEMDRYRSRYASAESISRVLGRGASRRNVSGERSPGTHRSDPGNCR
jgi:transposase, IS5 family